MRRRRKKGSFKEVVADFFELPHEVVLDLPRIDVYKRQVNTVAF